MKGAMNTDKIVKLIKLSESPEDGEALSAIRMAHAIARKGNTTLGDLFAKAPGSKKPWEKKASKEDPPIDEVTRECVDYWNTQHKWKQNYIVEYCVQNCDPDYASLYGGIKSNWLKHGKLTPRQIKCVVTNARYNGGI